MELLNDDLFKPFEEDEIENLRAIKGGVTIRPTEAAVWGDGETVIICQSDSQIAETGERIAGYNCRSYPDPRN